MSDTLTHQEYCQVIGQLYLDSYLKVQSHHQESTQLIKSLQTQLEVAKRANAELRCSAASANKEE